MKKLWSTALSICLLLALSSRQATAEMTQADSLTVRQDSTTTLKSIPPPTPGIDKKQTDWPNPRKAVLYSIIPGGGQIYNRKYWKLPIIAGAYTACYYAISWNNRNLKEYSIAFRDIKSDKPLENTSWVDFIPYGASPESYVNNTAFHDRLKRGRDFFRRNRDLSIIVAAGVYILVMVDAYVDAQLYHFDISPDLSLSYAPTITAPGPNSPDVTYGLQIALTF